jgi:hypothetical protein
LNITTNPDGPQPLNCTTGNPSVIFTEDFEVEPPVGWTGDFGTAGGDWDITSGNTNSTGTGPFASYSGGNHMEFEASGAGTTTASAISPAIDLSGAFSDAELSFWMHAFGGDMGTLDVGV